MLRTAIAIILVASVLVSLSGQDTTAEAKSMMATPEGKVEALKNASWKRIEAYARAKGGLALLGKTGGRVSVFTDATREALNQRLRAEGQSFYQKYPDDPRWCQWLIWTTAAGAWPRYWNDPEEGARIMNEFDWKTNVLPRVPSDEAAKKRWKETYEQLKSKMLGWDRVSNEDKLALWIVELSMAVHTMIVYPTEGEYYDLAQEGARIRSAILEAGRIQADWDNVDARLRQLGGASTLEYVADTFFTKAATWNLSEPDLRRFADELKRSVNPGLRDYGFVKASMLALNREPIDLRFAASDGRSVDLKAMRGKVVLLQYWSFGCAPCMQAFPKLKRLYDKYESQGFEIVGLSADYDGHRARMEEYLTKERIRWPQRLDYSKWREEMDRFSFQSVSNLLLLDKDGKLVTILTDPDEAELEQLILQELKRSSGGKS